VFSSKPGQKREKGGKPTVGFRIPPDLVEWLEQLKAKGADQTEVLVAALRVSRDVASVIESQWFEIEYRAKKKGIEPGQMLAELALAAMAAERNGGALPAPEGAANNKSNNKK